MVGMKNHLKGWKTPRILADRRVRQKPVQLDIFWDNPNGKFFEYDYKSGRSVYVSHEKEDGTR